MHEAPVHRVLVTGAAGGFGRTMTMVLQRLGFEVTGLARPEDNATVPLPPERLIRGYVEDSEIVARALKGQDAVINCAALLPNAVHLGYEAFRRVNVEGALNVLEQARKSGVRNLVYLSTISVVDHLTRRLEPHQLQEYVQSTDDPYLKSKIALEKELRREAASFEGRISIVRPAFIYGPGNFATWRDGLELVQRSKMVLLGAGRAWLPLIYAEDLAEFIALLFHSDAERAFDTYVLASPEPTTMRSVFDFIADHLGVSRPRSIPVSVASLAATVLSFVPRRIKKGRLDLLTNARVLQYSKGYDLSGVLNSPLGFTPKTLYQTGLAAMLDDYLGGGRAAARRP